MKAPLAIFALAILLSPALAQDDLFVPRPPVEDRPSEPSKPVKPAKPAKAHPLVGSWNAVEKGDIFCAGKGVITFASDGRGGVTGHAGFPTGGALKIATLKGNRVHFAYDYVDKLGAPQTATYDGLLSDDGDFISGNASGRWDDGCTFTMARR